MGVPPEPETTPSWISTPKLELGSQVPRCVMICTVQPPSNDVRARAVSVAAAAIVATAAATKTVRSDNTFIAVNLFRMSVVLNSHSNTFYRPNPANCLLGIVAICLRLLRLSRVGLIAAPDTSQ
jgi:hypothetical protein